MDPVMAEDPRLEDVPRGKHRQLPDDDVLSLRIEQCAVCRVVRHHEEGGDRENQDDFDRQDEERICHKYEQYQQPHVDCEITEEVHQTLPSRVLVDLGRDCVDDGLQRTLSHHLGTFF